MARRQKGCEAYGGRCIRPALRKPENTFKKHRVKTVYLECEGISVKQAHRFAKMLEPFSVGTVADETLDQLLCNMRLIKSRAEIMKIKEAQRITEEAYLETLNILKPGVTERELALSLEFEMKNAARRAQRLI